MNLKRDELLFGGAMLLGWILFATADPQYVEISFTLTIGLFLIALGNLGYGYLNHRSGNSTIGDDISSISFGVGLTVMGLAGLSYLPVTESFYITAAILGVGVFATIYSLYQNDTNAEQQAV